MKKTILLFLAIFVISFTINAQLTWSRVKVYGSHDKLQEMGDLGLPVDHGEYKYNTFFITDFSNEDIEKLDANGFIYEILIPDVKAFYVEQNLVEFTEEKYRNICPSTSTDNFDPVVPSNFNLGTMGGFYKYQEFIDELDDMVAQYPNLITAKAPINTFTTIDGNPIYWLKISDNPNTDEAEPEVLYSAIHHAREPASLSETIFYMWYLLENYGTNEEVTYLVDNTEMYFVPMINPDGYRYNELTEPNGGGMHRKNRRNVGSSNKGVDLNRNYGYLWGTTGTSTDPNNDTYPGTGEFSEVETQAMKWFVEQREFEFAFNAHTYGNQLLFPIGSLELEFADHHDYFARFTQEMVKYNGYENIKSSGLYPASGDSDDWMYRDDIGVNHDTVFAMTPEVSDVGGWTPFWPAMSEIEDICKNTVHMNMVLAHMPHVYGLTTDLENTKIETTTGYFNYEIERLGRMNGDFTISMTAIQGIQTLGGANTHTLNIMDIEEDSIQFTLNNGITFGDDIIYVIETDNGTWTKKDTVYKTFGAGTAVFADNIDNSANWSGSWALTSSDYYSASSSMTDSPAGNYSDQSNTEIELADSWDLSDASYAYITFWAKWEIENNWDYVQFMASPNGGTNWVPLCGKYTNLGSSNQDPGEPLYDDFQTSWVLEEVDLSDYVGISNVKFKFMLDTDQAVNEDGFYFDDFTVYTDATSGMNEFTSSDLLIYPNPTNNELNISFDNSIQMERIEITNELGQKVLTVVPSTSLVSISTTELAEGLYFLTAYSTDQGQVTERFVILR